RKPASISQMTEPMLSCAPAWSRVPSALKMAPSYSRYLTPSTVPQYIADQSTAKPIVLVAASPALLCRLTERPSRPPTLPDWMPAVRIGLPSLSRAPSSAISPAPSTVQLVTVPPAADTVDRADSAPP